MGVLLRPLGSTVYWMPPYIIEETEIDFLLSTVKRLLDAGGTGPESRG
jgi:adenosylmethionine-8-amino-7-oxononanoate aminotransferase